MPAEWEPQQAVWFSWPHNRDTWPTGLAETEGTLVKAVREIARHQEVLVNVQDARHASHVRRLVGTATNIRLVVIPTNDAWCRDHGATFVVDSTGTLAAVDWHYNAWGGKYPPYDLDQQVASRMATFLSVPRLESALTLEGGALESNGAGTLMTTASCVLNPNRNPGLSREEAEKEFSRLLGTTHVIWLGGELAGDDTDGHIDNLARFVREDVVVAPRVKDRNDPHYESFESNIELLQNAVTATGQSLQVIPLPHPDPVHHEGARLPASYMNFLISNGLVLVPTYHCSSDEIALEMLGSLFPARKIVGIDCTTAIRGLGALHCLSQQVPYPETG